MKATKFELLIRYVKILLKVKFLLAISSLISLSIWNFKITFTRGKLVASYEVPASSRLFNKISNY